MRIKKVMLYQAVPWNGGSHRELFSPETMPHLALHSSAAVLSEVEGGWVLAEPIKPEDLSKDTIKIGPANVACIVYERTAVVEPKKDLKSALKQSKEK